MKIPSQVRPRLRQALDAPPSGALVRVAGVLIFGFWSLFRGADTNEDLQNYHLYNAFALIHQKLLVDLAPAGFQSYFNPLVDVPYFYLNTVWPAPLVGLLLGCLHGLAFWLVLAIGEQVLIVPRVERPWLAVLLAGAGVLTAHFLSELGTSMGDDTTAIPTLAALLLVLNRWADLGRSTVRGIGTLAIAGLLAGTAAGLKLTNAVYAVALCAALLVHPSSKIVRIRIAITFGCAVLLGLAATGGYWMLVL